MGLAEIAVLIGAANGVILLIRPIGRLHQRIDRLEYEQQDLAEDIAKILGASGIKGHRRNG